MKIILNPTAISTNLPVGIDGTISNTIKFLLAKDKKEKITIAQLMDTAHLSFMKPEITEEQKAVFKQYRLDCNAIYIKII